MRRWKIVITLKEPFCCAAKPLEGNETVSLEYIPATTLRGAAAWKLCMEGQAQSLGAMLGVSGPRWSPAWPLAASGRTIIPTPQCYAEEKSGELPGIRNLFIELPKLEARQWKNIRAPFCEVAADGTPLLSAHSKQEVKMRNSLEYRRQASRGEELYARGELPEGAQFTAWIETEGEGADLPFEALNGEVVFGKRRSAGSGRAHWSLEQTEEECPPWHGPAPPAGALRIQLMTDAMVPLSFGSAECGFSPAMLSHAMAIEKDQVKVLRAFSSRAPVFGWSQAWGLPREQAVGIRAGSVCEFQFQGLTPDLQAAAIERLRQGVGVRRVEGFGILAVQPNWLYQDQAFDVATKDGEVTKPPRWPDLGLEYEHLMTFRGMLRDGPLEIDPALAVILAAQSTHLLNLDAVQEFVQRSLKLNPLAPSVKEFRRKCPDAGLPALQYWLRACASLSMSNTKNADAGRGGHR
jgi:hypothetical protein